MRCFNCLLCVYLVVFFITLFISVSGKKCQGITFSILFGILVCIEVMNKLQKAVDESGNTDAVKVVDDTCSTLSGKHKKIVSLLSFFIFIVFEYWSSAKLTYPCRKRGCSPIEKFDSR